MVNMSKKEISSKSLHIIADFQGCNLENLKKAETGERILKEVISEAGMTATGICSWQFEPEGYTAAVLLMESHATLHSWPEHAAVQIDIFSCGDPNKTKKAYTLLKEIFSPSDISEKFLKRSLSSIEDISS